MTCLLPGCAHLSMTATATPTRISEIGDYVETLLYEDCATVIVNPDRPNIYLEKLPSPPNIRKYDKYYNLIKPLSDRMAEKLCEFPVKIVYVESLEALGYYYQYLAH